MQIPVTCSGLSKARQTNSPHRSHNNVREATFGVVISLTRGQTSSALPSFLILPPYLRSEGAACSYYRYKRAILDSVWTCLRAGIVLLQKQKRPPHPTAFSGFQLTFL